MTRLTFTEFARQFGFEFPDAPNPYRKGSDSHRACFEGRDERLLRDMNRRARA